jgi:hypothetical protein
LLTSNWLGISINGFPWPVACSRACIWLFDRKRQAHLISEERCRFVLYFRGVLKLLDTSGDTLREIWMILNQTFKETCWLILSRIPTRLRTAAIIRDTEIGSFMSVQSLNFRETMELLRNSQLEKLLHCQLVSYLNWCT